MNLSCGSKTIKYLIFTFNFFFVITGIILISVGASIHAHYTQYNFFLNNEYFSLPNLLIATGTLIFIICFLGCYGAIKNSWIMLMGFSLLLGIIFIFEFSAGIAGYVLRDKTTAYLEDSMFKTMNDYNKSGSASAYMWDLIQRTYECCGVNNYTDWSKVMKSDDLPISCCPWNPGQSAEFYCNSGVITNPPAAPTTPTTPTAPSTPSTVSSMSTSSESSIPSTTPSTATTSKSSSRRKREVISVIQEALTAQHNSTTPPYRTGCESAFGKWVKSHAVDIGAVCFTLAVLQLIGIGFSCHLSKQLKNSYYST